MPWPTFTPAWADLPGLAVAELPTAGRGGPAPGAAERVWLLRWDPQAGAPVRDAWAGALAPAERERAVRIGTGSGQARFLASHAALHRIARATEWSNVSLTHTRWCAAVAAGEAPVGVDLEVDMPRDGWRRAARARWPGRSFEGRESGGAWRSFLRAWVIEEACFKAGAAEDRCVVGVTTLSGDRSLPAHVLAVARVVR